MADNFFDQIKELAEQHLTPLRERRDQLAKELKEVEAEIEAAENAVTAVTGGKKKSTGAKKSGKPAASDQQCTDFLVTAVSENDGITLKDAIALATEKIREGGFNTQGQYQRLKSLITKGNQITVNGDKCSVAA